MKNNLPVGFVNVKVFACDQHDYVADAEIRNFEASSTSFTEGYLLKNSSTQTFDFFSNFRI